MRMRCWIVHSIAGLLGFATAIGHGQETDSVGTAAPAAVADESAFLRLARDEAGTPLALQTSIVRFLPPEGTGPADLVVDLVGAIHIGDVAYYEDLNARFESYDAVLYELVAPEGTRVPLGGAGDSSLLSGLQGSMGSMLGLSFQLEHVDYTRPNLIHSDLSPEEVARSMVERGESASNLLARLMAVSATEYAKDPLGLRSVGLLAALFSPDRERLLKLQFAGMMLEMESSTAAFEGATGSTLIGERNRRAVSVLQQRIRAGDRRIAIFFGAAHMSGIAALIEDELGLRAGETVWVDAWNLR